MAMGFANVKTRAFLLQFTVYYLTWRRNQADYLKTNLDEKQSQQEDINKRNRKLAGTAVTVKNDCDVPLIVLFSDARTFIYTATLYSGYYVNFPEMENSYYINVQSVDGGNKNEIIGGNSWCYGGTCYKKETISADAGDSLTYPINCSESPPPPSPSPPSPTPPSPSPPSPTPPNASNEWLIQHNIRREKYHEQYQKDYVALEWSVDLENKAQAWVDELIKMSIENGNCHIEHAICNGYDYGGENLAANWGTSNESASEDNVLTRWTEEEEFLDFGPNGHFTQVIWRATTEVGCAAASTPMEYSGYNGYCHIQACRYLTPGNCNVQTTNWFELMLADTSHCAATNPKCP